MFSWIARLLQWFPIKFFRVEQLKLVNLNMVRTLLPTIIPPSYRGATIRYLYYVRCTLSGQYLNLENGPSHGGSIRDLSELESRIPFQVWVSQENNGLQSEEACNDGT
ncbi:uncharacterized protein LOC111409121 isoform X4 [Olea europaea var. sylvestris]|uniref:Uncharacterized protein n=2 Tax=Olea europaea subsp. europaea TaxID=158383 RepID=A0A8S0T3L3_OLEEU|nr:uncharacterized protein LOC111409121 isoform X4 [Olea europaea var. sylvestris]CAA2998826.1 Hypothetical predicted protein [Olea europaea subsp. europaea]